MSRDHHNEQPGEGFDWNSAYSGSESDYVEPDQDLLAIIDGMQPETVLDLGCGAGGLAIALAERGWAVTGVDLSENAIESARKSARSHGVEVEFFVADSGG
ncbi:MAG: class I SAM-dependent methyltransferase [Chloroflexi bacterium]|nr:class I SAM-dependent methyltransferase [Chloroflexota bacterium]